MPSIQSKNRVRQDQPQGSFSRYEIKKTFRPAMPRDDLRAAFAGNENSGPASDQKKENRGTHLKNRKTKKRERERQPSS